MAHLDDNAASEFVSGALAPAALERVERHLAGCRECRALVAALAADAQEDSRAQTLPHERPTESQLAQVQRRRLTVGDRVGRYLVLASLGAGGMGVVFAAYDSQLDRKIALKLLRSGHAGSSREARARLRREAQAIAQLSHPNVVSIYDVGATDDGDLYIAMEFVEGDTLTAWLRRYPRSWREIVDVFVQAARGLASAHAVGLLHRDFKPDNVLVGGDGRVRVTDFGLARSVLGPDEDAQARPTMGALDAALTATGTVLGTPRYMPPEQLTGPALDARSDQFSFCVALYEALYAAHPLEGGTAVAMLERGERARLPPETTKVPAEIGRAVLRGLERDRARRFPSMAALIDALSPRPRRSGLRAAALAAAGVAAVGGGVVALASRERAAVAVAPPSAPSIRELTAERARAEAERRQLLDERSRAEASAAEIARLTEALAEKDAEIARLGDDLERVRTALRRLAPRRSASPPIGTVLVDALAAAQGPLEGCFQEWAERIAGTPEERGEATVVVGLTITPEGAATVSRVRSGALPGQSGGPGTGLIDLCVSEQVARVRYPTSTASLDVEVTVRWWQPGLVSLSSRVIGTRPASRRQIEL